MTFRFISGHGVWGVTLAEFAELQSIAGVYKRMKVHGFVTVSFVSNLWDWLVSITSFRRHALFTHI